MKLVRFNHCISLNLNDLQNKNKDIFSPLTFVFSIDCDHCTTLLNTMSSKMDEFKKSTIK